jgi:biopolymer transport protein ExbD
MAIRLDHGSDELGELHDINVTPFIDVMLVLLIIFMVAAPLATVDIPVDLPKSAVQPAPRPNQPIYVTLKADLTLTIGNAEISLAALPAALDAATGANKDEPIFLRVDRGVHYGDFYHLVEAVRTAGYHKFSLQGLETRGAT